MFGTASRQLHAAVFSRVEPNDALTRSTTSEVANAGTLRLSTGVTVQLSRQSEHIVGEFPLHVFRMYDPEDPSEPFVVQTPTTLSGYRLGLVLPEKTRGITTNKVRQVGYNHVAVLEADNTLRIFRLSNPRTQVVLLPILELPVDAFMPVQKVDLLLRVDRENTVSVLYDTTHIDFRFRPKPTERIVSIDRDVYPVGVAPHSVVEHLYNTGTYRIDGLIPYTPDNSFDYERVHMSNMVRRTGTTPERYETYKVAEYDGIRIRFHTHSWYREREHTTVQRAALPFPAAPDSVVMLTMRYVVVNDTRTATKESVVFDVTHVNECNMLVPIQRLSAVFGSHLFRNPVNFVWMAQPRPGGEARLVLFQGGKDVPPTLEDMVALVMEGHYVDAFRDVSDPQTISGHALVDVARELPWQRFRDVSQAYRLFDALISDSDTSWLQQVSAQRIFGSPNGPTNPADAQQFFALRAMFVSQVQLFFGKCDEGIDTFDVVTFSKVVNQHPLYNLVYFLKVDQADALEDTSTLFFQCASRSTLIENLRESVNNKVTINARLFVYLDSKRTLQQLLEMGNQFFFLFPTDVTGDFRYGDKEYRVEAFPPDTTLFTQFGEPNGTFVELTRIIDQNATLRALRDQTGIGRRRARDE